MDLKQKLAAVLAGNGYRYWRAMQSFLLLKISRGELDSEAHICLKKEDCEYPGPTLPCIRLPSGPLAAEQTFQCGVPATRKLTTLFDHEPHHT